MRFRMWLGSVFSLAIAAGACVPGYTVTESIEPVSITGRLGGEVRDGIDCAWIVDANGKRTYLLWFEEGVVLHDPWRFVDAAGTAVARVGDTVTATGLWGALGETTCAAAGEATFPVDVITGSGGTLVFPTDPPY